MDRILATFAIAMFVVVMIFGGCAKVSHQEALPQVPVVKINDIEFEINDGTTVKNSSGGGVNVSASSEGSTSAKVGGEDVQLETDEETQDVADD